MKNTKIIGAILGIILFIALIGGLTYAFTSWTGPNINRKVSSECFDVLYDKGNDLTGAIIPSFDYTGGLSTTVRLNINSECNVNAKGILYLNTDEAYDKAGAYAIQGYFAKHIEKFEGCYDNVVGFPWNRIEEEIKKL